MIHRDLWGLTGLMLRLLHVVTFALLGAASLPMNGRSTTWELEQHTILFTSSSDVQRFHRFKCSTVQHTPQLPQGRYTCCETSTGRVIIWLKWNTKKQWIHWILLKQSKISGPRCLEALENPGSNVSERIWFHDKPSTSKRHLLIVKHWDFFMGETWINMDLFDLPTGGCRIHSIKGWCQPRTYIDHLYCWESDQLDFAPKKITPSATKRHS